MADGQISPPKTLRERLLLMKKLFSTCFRGILEYGHASLGWTLRNLRDLLGFLALSGIAVGFWWERPSLGLIVPSVIVLVMLVYSHLSVKKDEKTSS